MSRTAPRQDAASSRHSRAAASRKAITRQGDSHGVGQRYDHQMDMHRPSREDAWTVVFFYITIVVSMGIIAVPPLRALLAAKLAIFLMTLGMVVVFVRRESKMRTLHLTIQQIYAQAKLGRKFAPPAIELAATVVWCWATMVTL